ncbi:acyltransferase [Geodermatophilus sp. SYSU D01036]
MGTKGRLAAWIAAHELTPNRFRPRLVRSLGVHVDSTAIIFAGARFTEEAGVTIGARSFINRDCFIDASAPVAIGADVALGSGVSILTSVHDYSDPRRRGGPRTLLPVSIHDGAWIGTRALILPGVTVGAGAVVAAGAVVTRDVPPNVLVAGVPARPMKPLPSAHDGG